MKKPLKYEQALKRFVSYLKPLSTIVEINPNRGLYSQKLAKHGFQIIGLQDTTLPLTENIYLKELKHKRAEEVVIPFRSLGGIWAHDSLSNLEKKNCQQKLSLFYEWLKVEGVLYFCVLEGEGYKWITDQSPAGQQRRLLVYYQPEELAQILDPLGYRVFDAWRERHGEQAWLNILAKRMV